MLILGIMRFSLIIFFFLLSGFPFFSSQARNVVAGEAIAYREKGYKLQMMGDLNGALVYYQKAAQMDPHYAEVFNDLGVVYEIFGNEGDALVMYKKALRLKPSYLPIYTNLAFFYEKKGDIKNAAFYWMKRYNLGKEGEYWWEVSQQHLMRLAKTGKIPEIKTEILRKKATKLSQEISYKHEQEKLKLIEEARLHFDMGDQAFFERNYKTAAKEFKTVLFLNPPDEELVGKAKEFYKQSEMLCLKKQALVNAKSAVNCINSGGYQVAGDKLKNALSAVFSIIQEE